MGRYGSRAESLDHSLNSLRRLLYVAEKLQGLGRATWGSSRSSRRRTKARSRFVRSAASGLFKAWPTLQASASKDLDDGATSTCSTESSRGFTVGSAAARLLIAIPLRLPRTLVEIEDDCRVCPGLTYLSGKRAKRRLPGPAYWLEYVRRGRRKPRAVSGVEFRATRFNGSSPRPRIDSAPGCRPPRQATRTARSAAFASCPTGPSRRRSSSRPHQMPRNRRQ